VLISSKRFGLFGLLAVSIAFWWRALGETLGLAMSSDSHTHILLIIPLSAGLAYLNRKTGHTNTQSTIFGGAVLMAVALIIGGIARWGNAGWPGDVRLSLSMFAIVTWWIGNVAATYGTETLRRFLFPLCFLYWLVPLPDFALDKIVFSLQHLSALAASVLLQAGGIAVARDGTLLSMAGLDVDVAPQCSSIRSSLMLVITTMVLAHLFLRSRWRKALLIVAAAPLAAIKNGLRIFTLVEIGTRWDPQIFDSDLHHRGGIVFFAISVAMTILLLWLLRRTEIGGAQKLEVGARYC
jgi:exosortase